MIGLNFRPAASLRSERSWAVKRRPGQARLRSVLPRVCLAVHSEIPDMKRVCRAFRDRDNVQFGFVL